MPKARPESLRCDTRRSDELPADMDLAVTASRWYSHISRRYSLAGLHLSLEN